VVRVVLIGSVPIAWRLGVLSLPQLFVVAGLSGIATVFFGLAYTSYVPNVVERRDLTEANARLEVSTAVASLSGPGLAGAGIGPVGAPLALAADAMSFACSAALIGRTRLGHRCVRKRRRRVPRPKTDGAGRNRLQPLCLDHLRGTRRPPASARAPR